MDPARLTAIPIFSELSDDEAKRLAAFASETSAAEGQMLMKEGDYSVELIAIEEGTADVIQGGETVASLGPGDLIGEMGLLERKPRNADVIASFPDAAHQAHALGDPPHVRGHGQSHQGDDRGAAAQRDRGSRT